MLSLIPICILSGVLMLVTPTYSATHMQEVYQAKHLGCFSDHKLKAHKYYTEVKPIITWEICLHLCANKLTRYAGVQTKTNLCYCGEALLQLTEKTDPKSCDSCTNNQTQYCGGAATVSLYQFQSQERLTLLLATERGVELLRDNTLNTLVSGSGIVSVSYHQAKQDIYFIEQKQILRLSYVPVLMSYIPPTKVIERNKPMTDLTVDWVNMKLLWSSEDSQDIYQANMNGTSEKRRLYNAPRLRDLAFEPFKRLIFTLFDGKLSSIDNDGKLEQRILDKYHFNEIKELTLDIHFETVYLIGSFKSAKQHCLANTNYDASTFSVLYCGPELSNPTALDIFNDTVVWVNYNKPKYSIYKSHISPRGKLENVNLFHQSEKNIYKLKIFHPEVQTPSTKRLCELLACSHQCNVITFSAVECSCPDDMLLGTDDKTCTEPINDITTSNIEASSDTTFVDTESTDETSETISTDNSSSEVSPDQTKDSSTEAKVPSEVLNNAVGLKLSVKPTSPSTIDTSHPLTHETGVTNSHVLITNFFFFIVLAGLLAGILYVQLKIQKGQQQNNRDCDIPSELEMLTR